MLSDNVDHLIASVDAGTNDGTAWTRPGSVPASSATLLVTQYKYNSAGLLNIVIDPLGIKTVTNYDSLGRVVVTIQDYTNGTETTESNIQTTYNYDGNNNVINVYAFEPGGGYQKTHYVYGVTTASGSGVNSNDILSAIQHPDPSSGNPSSTYQDSYLVNALSQVVQDTDPNGNVHQYGYDVLGRLTSDAVTTLGAGVDGSVRRIAYGYDSQGNQSLLTSYDAASGGNIVKQVQRVYNGLGQLTGEYQSHSGAVVQGTTPEVQYAYNEMSNGENNSRLVSMTYPSGYRVDYNYDSGLDDRISRLSSLSEHSTSTVLESYLYLGLNTVVERDHPQNNVNLTYISQNGQTGDAGDQYTGLDRFGRVVDQNWYNTTTQTSTDDFQYGYDQDSNVLYKQNLVDAALSELYQYNSLNELINYQQGTLNSSNNGIVGTPSASQSWTPDALGNFTSVTTNSSNQTSTFNQQNEITGMSGAGTVSYDANGNLTADGSGNTYVYDAWNELVAVKNSGGTTTASYTYDGLGRRITATEGGTTTDLYYSSADQVLEEDVGGVTQARNVWSPVYVNAMVLRDQSSQHNGVLDQRLYVQQDANWNVTALVDTSGNVVERYDYLPYGSVTVLSANWTPIVESAYNVPVGFQGMGYDWTVGLNYSQSRVYDPTLMRWLQTDPAGLNAGNNDYEFAGNGPTDAVDPSGLDAWETAKQVGWWFADNTLGLGNTAVSMVGLPNVYRAVRQGNPYHLIPGSFYYYSLYKDPVDSYNAYKEQGLPTEDAVGLTFMHQVPIVSSVWGGAEMIAGYSSRAGEVGKPLTAGDYATRVLDIGRDTALPYLAQRQIRRLRTGARISLKGEPCSPQGTAPTTSRGFTPDQQALQQLVNGATRGGRVPLSALDAQTVMQWAREVNYPGFRAGAGDLGSPSNWTANPVPHIHLPGVGRGGHVPVAPGLTPP